ncbi:MAG: porin [Gammaproteobacteria bacterium]|jgi:predicted porin
MMKWQHLINRFIVTIAVTLSTTALAADEFDFYGAFKVSLNTSDDGDESNLSVSNNSSRVGIKGGKSLKDNMNLVYQLEMEFDTTERERFNSGRNSFIGVEGDYGQILAGQHDTPLKDIRAHGADIFGDTIADIRSTISAVADDSGTRLDIRARNAIMYKSPKENKTKLFFLYSADRDANDTPDDNSKDLVGISVMHVQGPVYVGLAYENQSVPGAEDIDAIRFAGSYKFGDYQIGAIVESADAGDNNSLTREAYAFNGRYNLTEKTWTGVQLGMVADYDGSSDTGATNISAGISHDLADATSVYAVISQTMNDDNASFGLSQGGIQDTVTAAFPGDDVSGISVGLVHKF